MMEKVFQFLQKDSSIWGSVSLLCTLAIAAKASIPADLLGLALTGLYLCTRLQMRGCYYALALLGVFAAFKHAFFTTDHLWQLGIEGSLVLAFFILALASEQAAVSIASLQQQLQTRQATVANLEDELAKAQEAHLAQQMTLSEKVCSLQKELEELQADHSSILILNDVLRKTTARSESALAAKGDLEWHIAFLKAELQETRKDLERVADIEALAVQNRELLQELNAARCAKEQTHLINETLARLYARESLKAKEADQEAADLTSQLSAARKEVERVSISLQEQLAIARNQVDTLTVQLERASTVQKFHEVKGDPQLVEKLAYAEQKMVHLSQMEPLLKQLRKQFEEKAQVLQETRTHLFRTDTELQKALLEKTALELSSFPEMEQELQVLGEQVEALEEENEQLQELVSALTDNSPDAAKRKKKVKTQTPPEQELLF
jgi:DNA repair exonuclease SbcCD ATPase subunit